MTSDFPETRTRKPETDLLFQDVAHRVKPRRLADQPTRRVQRAAREDIAISRLVGQLQAFPITQEHHRMFARHVAAPNRLVSDLAAGPTPSVVAGRRLVVIQAALARDRAPKRQRSA